jgi:hypothetical protein
MGDTLEGGVQVVAAVYPYPPQAHVAMTSARTYLGLLTAAAS